MQEVPAAESEGSELQHELGRVCAKEDEVGDLEQISLVAGHRVALEHHHQGVGDDEAPVRCVYI